MASKPQGSIHTTPGSAVPAVRFKTTAWKLLAWRNAEVQGHHGKVFLGRVRYWSEAELIDEAKSLRAGSVTAQIARTAARALHRKRRQFKLEASRPSQAMTA